MHFRGAKLDLRFNGYVCYPREPAGGRLPVPGPGDRPQNADSRHALNPTSKLALPHSFNE